MDFFALCLFSTINFLWTELKLQNEAIRAINSPLLVRVGAFLWAAANDLGPAGKCQGWLGSWIWRIPWKNQNHIDQKQVFPPQTSSLCHQGDFFHWPFVLHMERKRNSVTIQLKTGGRNSNSATLDRGAQDSPWTHPGVWHLPLVWFDYFTFLPSFCLNFIYFISHYYFYFILF